MAALQKLVVEVPVQARVGRTAETDKLAWDTAVARSRVEPEGFQFEKAVPSVPQPGVVFLRYSAMGVPRT